MATSSLSLPAVSKPPGDTLLRPLLFQLCQVPTDAYSGHCWACALQVAASGLICDNELLGGVCRGSAQVDDSVPWFCALCLRGQMQSEGLLGVWILPIIDHVCSSRQKRVRVIGFEVSFGLLLPYCCRLCLDSEDYAIVFRSPVSSRS